MAKKFSVTFDVEGRYTAEVMADTIEEAKEKAERAFNLANFGEFEYIDSYEFCGAKDSDGNWYDQ
jgi:hypothetical protein